MKKLIEFSMKKYFQMRMYKIDFWKKNPKYTQDFTLINLINQSQDTVFGKQYGFKEIHDYPSYIAHVPIFDYGALEPYINNMLKGEENILYPGKITMFSKSSGTTGSASKYIPVSKSALYRNNYKAGKDIYSLFFDTYPESNILKDNGSVFSLGGSYTKNEYGIKVGDISALIMAHLPSWAQKQRQPSIKVALMKKWENKIPAMIDDTYDKNITHLSGVPTWFISLFESLQKKHPYTNLRDIWPNLELFIHGAVSFSAYKPIFESLLPFDDMKYMEVYNASEGFFAVQDDFSKPGEMLLLTDHGIFYEFIPMKDYGTPSAQAIMIDDVELGVNYAMIITTNAGLWRYDIGDTVMFTSTNPYRIKITGRTKHFINVFGEELMVGNTDEAITAITQKHNCSIAHYTVAPIFMSTHSAGGHEWIIEFKELPENPELFQLDLDNYLQSINTDYAAKRQNNIAMRELVINTVSSGTFERWLASQNKLGGQYKIPKLSNTREYLESILKHTD